MTLGGPGLDVLSPRSLPKPKLPTTTVARVELSWPTARGVEGVRKDVEDVFKSRGLSGKAIVVVADACDYEFSFSLLIPALQL